MRIIAELTENELKCIKWLSVHSWKYYYLFWGKGATPEYIGFYKKYKDVLFTFDSFGCFNQNELKGSCEVTPLWLEIFRNALKQHQCNTTEN